MEIGMQNGVIKQYAEVLPMLDGDDRPKKLEEFDEVFGVDLPDWEERLKAAIRELGRPNAEDAIAAIDAFHAKYHVYDENGNRIFERTRIGNGYHQIVITYDSKAPEGQEITIREVPDIEAMSLEELQDYYEELQSALGDIEDEEPDGEDSQKYSEWEDRYSEMEELLEEVGERLEEMGGDV